MSLISIRIPSGFLKHRNTLCLRCIFVWWSDPIRSIRFGFIHWNLEHIGIQISKSEHTHIFPIINFVFPYFISQLFHLSCMQLSYLCNLTTQTNGTGINVDKRICTYAFAITGFLISIPNFPHFPNTKMNVHCCCSYDMCGAFRLARVILKKVSIEL